ncbi:MAG: DUF1684 domain-containing protein, partial [Planctomycetia bacterium]
MLLTLLSCTSTPTSVHKREHAEWHAARLSELRDEQGWLSLVGLDFLTPSTYTVGSAPTARLHDPGCSAPLIGTWVVEPDSDRFHAEPGVEIQIKNGAEAQPLRTDVGNTPSVVRYGRTSSPWLRRNGQFALRVRDPRSSSRTHFTPIAMCAYDELYRMETEVTPAAPGQHLPITNVTGYTEQEPFAGFLSLVLDDQVHRFVATAGKDGRLLLVFSGPTNGKHGYLGGRFLDIPAPHHTRTWIDFNRAINALRSFTGFGSAPLPPPRIDGASRFSLAKGDRPTPERVVRVRP